MHELTRIAATDPTSLAQVHALQAALLELPQTFMRTDHIIHGGLYVRTITVPAGVAMVGALIKIPTLVIVQGHVTVTVGEDSVELSGYHLLPASAGRKQAWFAHADTTITMVFPTTARTVEEAEAQFTDETDLLMSRAGGEQDTFTFTGE